MDGIIPYAKLNSKADLINGKVPSSQLPGGSGTTVSAESVTYDSSISTHASGSAAEALASHSSHIVTHIDCRQREQEV